VSKKNTPATSTSSPTKPSTYGKISEATSSKIAAMRNRTSDLLGEIGRIEVRKTALIRELQGIDAEAGAILAEEATRLGVPKGSAWRIDADGMAVPND
jgi:hypothetical protein